MCTKALLIVLCAFTLSVSQAWATLSPQWQTHMTVTVEQLRDSQDSLLILDARQSNPEDACIPHSIAVDWKTFYAPDHKTLLPDAERIALVSALGITGKEHVVIYDNGLQDGGAEMLFWVLDSLGHPKASILEGGWEAYKSAKLSLTSTNAIPRLAHFEGTPRADAVMPLQRLMTVFGDYDLLVLDPRSDEEFMGWPLHNEKRGGHIRGAVNFNPAWAYTPQGMLKPENEIRRLMYQKGITPEKKFFVYSNFDARGAQLYFLLNLMGFDRVSLAGFTFNVWSDIPSLPVSSATNWKALVSPQWVEQLVRTGSAPTYAGEKFAVYEVSWGGMDKAKAYQEGHIPTAFHLDSDIFEDERHYWDLFPTEELFARFASQGIDKDTTVVVYGNGSNTIAATVAFWAMKVAGVEDVRLLNGNFERWKILGLPVDTTPHMPKPIKDFGRMDLLNPQYVTSTEGAKSLLADPHGRLASVRSWEEYSGEVVRHSYIKAKGELKGAYWARAGFGNNKSDLSFYFDVDGSYRSYAEVAAMWASQDILPQHSVAFYCGTGSRGSTGWFYSYLMGWPRTSLYDSGWYGWTEGKAVSPNPSQNIWNDTHQ